MKWPGIVSIVAYMWYIMSQMRLVITACGDGTDIAIHPTIIRAKLEERIVFECCTQDSTITFVVWNSSGSIIHKWNRHGISTTDWIPDGLGILHANLTVNATLANDGIHVACLIAGKSSNLAHLIVEQQENDTTGSGLDTCAGDIPTNGTGEEETTKPDSNQKLEIAVIILSVVLFVSLTANALLVLYYNIPHLWCCHRHNVYDTCSARDTRTQTDCERFSDTEESRVSLQHGSSLVVQRSNRHAPPLALVREVKETVTVTVDGSEDDPKLFSCNDDDDSKSHSNNPSLGHSTPHEPQRPSTLCFAVPDRVFYRHTDSLSPSPPKTYFPNSGKDGPKAPFAPEAETESVDNTETESVDNTES